MTNGWTGGQYSLYRVALGVWLALRFVGPPAAADGILREALPTPPATGPDALVLGGSALGAALSVLLAAGRADRIAAPAVAVLWAVGRGVGFDLGGVSLLIWLPGLHTLGPGAPYGSWTARRRVDPAGSWSMPGGVYAAVWIVLAFGYAVSGARAIGAGVGPLLTAVAVVELAFAPLSLFRPLRPWLWCVSLLVHLPLIGSGGPCAFAPDLLLVHLLAFDPAWIPPARAGLEERLFYDGSCGLCHRAVRFVLAEDRTGCAFRFAPLDGPAFRSAVPESARRELPDSIVVRTEEGALRTRSAAILRIAERLGGLWRVGGRIARLLPEPVRDAAYDAIASIRHRLFRRPDVCCPVLPTHLRARFDA